MDSPYRRNHLYLSAFILNINYFFCGVAYAWSSPVLPKLAFTSAQGGNIASSLSLGSILGPFLSGALLDRVGRKGTVGLSAGLMTASFLVLALSEYTGGIWVYCAGRFLGGVSSGITFSAVPLYIAEISDPSIRGFLNTFGQIFVCIGCLLVYAMGPFVTYSVLHYVILGFCFIYFILFSFLPASPYHQVMKNNIDGGRKCLTWLREDRSPSSIEKELREIQEVIHQNQSKKANVSVLFTSRSNRRALFICAFILALQQCSGCTLVFFYSQSILEMSGTNISNSTCSIVVGVIMLLSAFPSPVAVKYFGYKKPLMVSVGGSSFGMATLGGFLWLKLNSFEVDNFAWMPLLSTATYILFFNLGWANIPWALTGELFPNDVKPIATAVNACLSGSLAFITSNLFPDLIHHLGLAWVFIACSFFSCVCLLFIVLVVQDTSGLTFVQIQELMSGEKRKDVMIKRSQLV